MVTGDVALVKRLTRMFQHAKIKLIPLSLKDLGDILNLIKLNICEDTRNVNCSCNYIDNVYKHKYFAAISYCT